MILAVHFLLSINRKHWINCHGIQIQRYDSKRAFLQQISIGTTGVTCSDLKLFLREFWGSKNNALEVSSSLGRVEGDIELKRASRSNSTRCRFNFEGRIIRWLWFYCLKLKFERAFSLVISEVLDNVNIEEILICIILIIFVLIKYLPIDLHRLYSSILDVESF